MNQPTTPPTSTSWSDRFAVTIIALLIGTSMGAAWIELIPPFVGVLGLGLFFLQQSASSTLKTRVTLALLVGMTGYGIGCFWLPDSIQILAGSNAATTWLLFAIAIGFQAMVFPLFSIVYHWSSALRIHWSAVPVIWFVTEQLFPFFYPCHVGYLLAGHPALCQSAELGGSPLVSLHAAFIAFGFAAFIGGVSRLLSLEFVPTSFKQAVVVSSLVLIGTMGVVSWGHFRIGLLESKIRIQSGLEEELRLLVVQCKTGSPNSHRRMLTTTRQLEGKTDLVIWPECAIGQYDQMLEDFSDSIVVGQLSKGQKCRENPFPNGQCSLIAGGDSYTEVNDESLEYVSAFLFNEHQNCVGRHDKIELMPGGEYIPFESCFPFLRTLTGSDRVISRGHQAKVLGEVNGVKIGTVLCCEDMYPRLARDMSADGAQILISIGNGMAFKSVRALRQHFRISRLRSIENRKYFVRGTSHGVSAVVSPTGKIIHEIPSMEDNAMYVRVPVVELGDSWFERFGSGLTWAIAISVLLAMITIARFGKR